MNGLKYIRTRCNYSQRALAEAIGVSRQAINMWEGATKTPTSDHKEELCNFFGIDDPELLGELTPERYEALQKRPVYKRLAEGESERFSFKRGNEQGFTYQVEHFSPAEEDTLSLDDKCTLKRAELKNILREFSECISNDGKKNSIDNFLCMNHALGVLVPALDLLKESMGKRPEYCMIYYRTLLATLDAVGISFGTVETQAILNQESDVNLNPEWYDYRQFSVELAEIITRHLDQICVQIPTKAKNPHENFRRREKKTQA